MEIALAFIAIVLHLVAGYYWIGVPTIRSVKILLAQNGKVVTPIFRQEYTSFIFFPIVGYLVCFVLKEFAGDIGLFNLPAIMVIQFVSFATYFYSRSNVRPRSIFELILMPSILLLGMVTCVILAIKLFSYYLVCITVGWIFVILPLCMMAYYALFQVIAFQCTELIKILKFAKNFRPPSQSESFPQGLSVLYLGVPFIITQVLTFALCLFGLYMLIRRVDLGIFNIEFEHILSQPRNFFF